MLSRKDLGGSLPVENVQALASKSLMDIPSRYLWSAMENEELSIDDSLQIPVIDMSKLGSKDELEKLHLACRGWGFFQVCQSNPPYYVLLVINSV